MKRYFKRCLAILFVASSILFVMGEHTFATDAALGISNEGTSNLTLSPEDERQRRREEHAIADLNQQEYNILSNTNDVTTIGKTLNYEGISIDNLKFKDHSRDFHSSDPIDAIGYIANITSQYSQDQIVLLRTRYYDVNMNFIKEDLTQHYAPAGETVTLVNMSEASDFRDYRYDHPSENPSDDTYLPRFMQVGIMRISPRYFYSMSMGDIDRGDDFVYTDYKVNIKVHENESFDIREQSNAYFLEPRHGIVRHIPYIYETDLGDRRRANIENINVNQSFNSLKNRSSKTMDLRIGDPEKTVTGEVNYDISYRYSIDKKESKQDSFYFNLVQDEHIILNAEFQVELPKSFDPSRIGFTSGRYGSHSNEIIYFVQDNKISGILSRPMRNGSITLRLGLGDSYFDNPGIVLTHKEGRLSGLILVIPIILTVAALLIWFKKGRDTKLVEPIEFYPPNDMNSLEVQQFIRGKANASGVISLLPYLASKGYIKIREEKSEKRRSSCTFIKLKDYDGSSREERLLMEELFRDGDSISSDTLHGEFYRTVNKVLSSLGRKTIYNENTFFRFVIDILLIAAILIPVISYSYIYELGIDTDDFSVFFMIFSLGFFFAISHILGTLFGRDLKGNIITFLVSLTMMSPFLIASFVGFYSSFDFVELSKFAQLTFILMPFEAAICAACAMAMPKRKKKYESLLGRISGFKRFLETAEKSRLESITANDASYFYDIIPFAYVMGISKKWMQKFEDIALPPAEWLDDVSSNSIDYTHFCEFMNHNYRSVSNYISYDPTSTSSSSGSGSSGGYSGSSSGGGSSGGGGGGGGSSSW